MTAVSDNFNRANEALSAGPWTLVNWSGTSAGFNVVSNQCVVESTNRSGAIHDTALATSDHRVEAKVVDYDIAVFARGSSDGQTGYFANCWAGSTELFKVEAGVVSFINNTDAVPLGDTVFIEVDGDQITFGKVGGITNTVTDASITTGTKVGVGASGNNGTLDDWSAADLGGGGPVVANYEPERAMNLLAGTTGLSIERAANVYAGTTGLSLERALNVKALTTGLSATRAANVLAGTTGLELRGALNALLG